ADSTASPIPGLRQLASEGRVRLGADPSDARAVPGPVLVAGPPGRAQAVGAAEDHVHRPGIRESVDIPIQHPNCQIHVSVTVEVTGTGIAVPEPVLGERGPPDDAGTVLGPP